MFSGRGRAYKGLASYFCPRKASGHLDGGLYGPQPLPSAVCQLQGSGHTAGVPVNTVCWLSANALYSHDCLQRVAVPLLDAAACACHSTPVRREPVPDSWGVCTAVLACRACCLISFLVPQLYYTMRCKTNNHEQIRKNTKKHEVQFSQSFFYLFVLFVQSK